MGIDATRLLERAIEMQEACRFAEGNPGLELGLRLGVRVERRPRTTAARSASGWSSSSPSRPASRGRASFPRPTTRTPSCTRTSGYPTRTSSGRSSSAGSSPSRSPGRSSGSTRSTSPTCRRRRTRRTRCSRGGDVELEPRGLARRAARAGASEGDYVCIQAFVDPAREAELAAAVERARESGHVVTHGLGPRYLHSTGQLHKGGPNTGLFLQVVDDPGDELPIPGQRLRLRAR